MGEFDFPLERLYADALKSRTVRTALPRYVSMLEEGKHARFQIARRLPCAIGLNSTIERLWAEHARLRKEFAVLVNKADHGLSLGKPAGISFLDLKLELARRLLRACCFCERRCGVNREHGERGDCGAGKNARVASVFRHMDEEPYISPSLTVFFAGCNFHCASCQNWDISQFPTHYGETSAEAIAKTIDTFPEVRNVNLVGGEPTPNLHVIIEALSLAERDIPVVWNSNMYMSYEAMQLLDGVVDVFLSDFKYGNDDTALKYSGVRNYFSVVTRNHELACGYAEMVIRVLFLPGEWARTDLPNIIDWIAKNCREKAMVNLMRQYHPEYKARLFPELCRNVRADEFEKGRVLLERHLIRTYP